MYGVDFLLEKRHLYLIISRLLIIILITVKIIIPLQITTHFTICLAGLRCAIGRAPDS